MEILVQVVQLLLSLSLLVVVHELGHFMFARLFKVRVDKFYLFFNPWRSIFRVKRIGDHLQWSWFSAAPPEAWKEYPQNTEWGLGWLPFGGYCKIAGMIDESMDKEQLKQPPQPWEYRTQATWKRFFIIIGGVVMNFVAAMVIYAVMLFVWGREILPIKNVTYGYSYCQVAKDAGFEDGDKIVRVVDFVPQTLAEAVEKVLLSDGETVTVERNGSEATIQIPEDFSQQILAKKVGRFAQERTPFVVMALAPGSPAEAAGLQVSDSIVGFNGNNYVFYSQFFDSVQQYAGQTITLALYRNNELLEQEITLDGDAKLGVYTKQPYQFFATEKQTFGFFESIPAGVTLGMKTLKSYVQQFKIVFTKEGAKSLGGFGTIGGLFSKVWDWGHFWNMTAFISIILAFMNILPIPALDGGHLVFIVYEMITRRAPSDKFLERVQTVGWFLLIALLIFANGNDLLRLFAGK